MTHLKLALAAAAISATALMALDAFPGAEGWGKNSVGGRGGQVIHVTNLSGYGAGSLSAACGVSGPKIIVFDTAGVINLSGSPLSLNANTTIAGQTAPGGITLINGGIYTSSNDIIVRFIRVRRSADVADGDCFRFTSSGAHDIMLDHCSGFWCSDEILDMSYLCYNITIQSCVIAEPLEVHAMYGCETGCGNNRTGILSTENDGRITFYRMILAHVMKRVPFCSNMGKTAWQGKTYEFINNVVYNCMSGSGETFDMGNNIPLNLKGNYYKGGPDADYGSNPYAHAGTMNPKSMIVHSDSMNYHFKYPKLKAPAAFFYGATVLKFVDTMIPPRMTTVIDSGTIAYQKCLTHSGVIPRDSTERRLMYEIATGTGNWRPEQTKAAPYAPYQWATGRVPADTDRDGMPNTWETAHGLNPNNAADRTTAMNGGYNAVEVYLNELADSLMGAATISVEKSATVMKAAGPMVTAGPNPFMPAINFSLVNVPCADLRMDIVDVRGRLVYSSNLPDGVSTVTWDGTDAKGKRLPGGTYMARFSRKGLTLEKRVTLVR